MIGVVAEVTAIAWKDIAAVAAGIATIIGVGIGISRTAKQAAKENTIKVTKLEEDVESLKEKVAQMVSNVDKLNFTFSDITTKQAVMEVKLDQLQLNVNTIVETCRNTNESLNKFMIDTSSNLATLRTEISMLRSRDN